MKKLATAFLGLALLTCSLEARGFGGFKGHGSFDKQRGSQTELREPLFQDLELTTEQTEQIVELKEELRTNMHQIDPFAALKDATTGGSFDKDIFKESSLSNHEKRIDLMADFQESVFNLLSFEQQTVYIQNIQDINVTK